MILFSFKKSLIISKTNSNWEIVNDEDSIRLLTIKEYKDNLKVLRKELLNSDEKEHSQKYWWISDKKNYRLVLPDGYVSHNKLYDVEKLGIRPVIALKERED